MWRVLTALLGLCVLAVPAAAGAPESQKGRLRIVQHGQTIGTEDYEIAATSSGVEARAMVELKIEQTAVRHTTRLQLSADLSPRAYEWKMTAPVESWVRIEFDGGNATIHFPLPDGKEDTQSFEFANPRVALLDNNVFHHFLFLAALYDFERGGPQKLWVFIPQSVQPGEVSVELQGTDAGARHLVISTEDNRVEFWVTPTGHFVRLLVPAAGVEVVPETPAP